MQQEQTKSIFVAIVGRPNVGKSSLLNRMVGEKVAIVTAKPQTTRTRITGILTRGAVQYVFLDTPGIHRPRTRLGERMAKATADSVAEVDAVVMLFEPYGELTEARAGAGGGHPREKSACAGGGEQDGYAEKETDLAVRSSFWKSWACSGACCRCACQRTGAVRNCWTHCCLSRWKALTISRTTPTPGHAGKGSRGGGAAGKDAAEPAGRDSPRARL